MIFTGTVILQVPDTKYGMMDYLYCGCKGLSPAIAGDQEIFGFIAFHKPFSLPGVRRNIKKLFGEERDIADRTAPRGLGEKIVDIRVFFWGVHVNYFAFVVTRPTGLVETGTVLKPHSRAVVRRGGLPALS
jgi:hypothetical protein